jgi:hypothetical protein
VRGGARSGHAEDSNVCEGRGRLASAATAETLKEEGIVKRRTGGGASDAARLARFDTGGEFCA